MHMFQYHLLLIIISCITLVLLLTLLLKIIFLKEILFIIKNTRDWLFNCFHTIILFYGIHNIIIII